MFHTMNSFKEALRFDEYNNAAKHMMSWYAEYVEGYIDASKDLFNEAAAIAPREVWLRLIEQNKEIGFSTLDKHVDKVLLMMK